MKPTRPSNSAWILTSITVVALLLLVSGCTVLKISHTPAGATKPTPVPGVPFFAKKARCRQEVSWFEPIYTLTLVAVLPDKDGALQNHPRGAVVLSRSSFESPEITLFMKLLNNKPTDEGTVQQAWQKVVARADPHVLSRDFGSLSAADRILVGRAVAPVVYVDYSDQYYVNAKVPLAGSASVDAKVAEDGSLSELSGQTENKTLETILSALPISSVITGGLGLGGKSIASAGEVEALQLTVSISGYKHTLARLVDYPTTSKPCPVASDIPFAEATEYKREDISAADTSQGDKTGGKDTSSDKAPTGSQKKKPPK